MQLLEHQAKTLLRQRGVPIPASTLVPLGAQTIPGSVTFPCVLKSQVPVGGRGKLGGVRLVRHREEYEAACADMAAREIKGHLPESILAEAALEIEREMYLALRVNRDSRCIEWLVSNRGGIDIEVNAASVKIVSQTKNDDAYETICDSLKLPRLSAISLLKRVERCMIDNDLLLLEINPLVFTKTDELIAADCKMLVDDNALFRHPDYANHTVSSSVLPLGGTIGVIANGAGMAMSTMDTIYAAGGRPANFLDIGGGTGEDVFVRNLRDITQLPGVTSIIVNIFAGITRCDDIARGIIAARQQIPDLVPLYIRLEGTRRQEAVELLDEAGIEMLPDLKTCVQKALGTEKKEHHDTLAAGDSRRGNTQTTFSVRQKNSLGVDREAGPAERERTNDPPIGGSGSDHLREDILKNHPTIVQGITGHHGSFHTRGMLDAGTRIVAGVTPGKAGHTVHGVPVYDTVAEALKTHQATASVMFVPPQFARTAAFEALDAGLRLLVIITEGIPVHDMLAIHRHSVDKNATIIGPNCPGLIVPGSHKLGIIASSITTPGHTAIISRSGTLTYELADALTKQGIGQRIVIGIGGDPIQGFNFSEALQLCQDDPAIDRIIMVGEIGGTSEQIAADYAAQHVTKPIYGLVVGHSLPPGQQFGHAGAIVGYHGESAAEKTSYMTAHGIHMSTTLDELIYSSK